MAFVNCKKCGAEVTDERKTCPHCQEEIVPAVQVALEMAKDDKERSFIKQLVDAERAYNHVVDMCNYLKEENNRLHSENTELRKQIAPPPTVAEKTGPGVATAPVPNATLPANPPATETAKTV
jgi:hypothetical protein